MIYPVRNFVITSSYGNRILNGKKQFHDGIDFISRENNIVLAVTDGVVEFDEDNYEDAKRWVDIKHSAGNYLIIRHAINGEIYYCRYLHLGENFVSKGDTVEGGQKIGTYADAGISYGAHLHFDVYDKDWKKIDPAEILNA